MWLASKTLVIVYLNSESDIHLWSDRLYFDYADSLENVEMKLPENTSDQLEIGEM